MLTVDHPGSGDTPTLRTNDRERAKEFADIEVRKASNLLELLDGAKSVNGKVDCLAFSEGALNTLIAAYLHPERFRKIILAAPAGLIGEDSVVGLSARFATQVVKNMWGPPSSLRPLVKDEGERARLTAHSAATWKEESVGSVAKSLGRTWDELSAIANMRVDELLQSVRAKGVQVYIVSGADDRIFPSKIMTARLPAGSVDGFMGIQGAHDPHFVAHAAESIFSAEHTAFDNN